MNERILAGAVGLLLTCACNSNPKTMATIDADMATFDTAPPARVEAADEVATVEAAPDEAQPISACCSEQATNIPTLAEEIDSAPAVTPSMMDDDTGGFNAINVYLSRRNFQGADINLSTIGVEWASEREGSQLGYEVSFWFTPENDASKASDSGFTEKDEIESWEIAVGARRTFRRDKTFRPYLGAGLNWVHTEITNTVSGPGVSDRFNADDGTFGLYLHLGAMWKFTDLFGLGIDYRASDGFSEATFSDQGFSTDQSLNYDQLSILLTFQF